MAYYISNIRLYNRESINMNIGFIIKKILGTKYYIVKTKELDKEIYAIYRTLQYACGLKRL